MNILETRINQIKEAGPKLKDFLEAGFDLEYANQILSDFKIELKRGITNDKFDTFKLFNQYVDFRTFSVFGINFVEYEEYEDFFHIGFLESDYIILLKTTNEIAVLNHDTSEVNYFLSENFESFLELIPILVSYDKIGYLGESYTDLIKKDIVEKIKKILSQEKYYSFFVKTIGV